ncbi:hypothetical protein HMPREF1602_03655 [Escherichia coli 907889]|nr:hypothetical protein HMPREF1588_04325 [Escherichia coli 110957]ESD37075.1 hypothetical protein HMPREF1602_03655 [Escherichia coli 907889]
MNAKARKINRLTMLSIKYVRVVNLQANKIRLFTPWYQKSVTG